MKNELSYKSAGIPRRHLHVVGCSPRSGTTLLYELIVSCFEVDERCDHEESAFKVISDPGSIYCSKNPNEAPAAPCLLAINRDFYCIFLLRDPRDVVVSQHNKDKGIYFSNLRVWREYVSFARSLEGHDRFMMIRYEDLVRDPDAMQDSIARRFPFLRKKKHFSEFHANARVSPASEVALGGVREIAPTSVGRWREHKQRLADQLSIHGDITRELAEFDYERSSEWLCSLPQPSSSPAPGRLPDHLALTKRYKRWFSLMRKFFYYFIRVRCPRIFILFRKLDN